MKYTLLIFFCLISNTTAFSHISFSHYSIVAPKVNRLGNFVSSLTACSSSRGQISSLSNPLVKRLVRLRENSRFRQEEGSALLVGSSPIQEVLLANDSKDRALRTLLLLEDDGDEWHQKCLSTLPCQGAEIYTVSSQVMKKVSGLETAERHISVAEISLPREVRFKLVSPGGFLRLTRVCDLTARIYSRSKQGPDFGQVPIFPLLASLFALKLPPHHPRIQDPGNLGTILRTASGLGWTGVFLLDGCCDPFNEKSLRAARSAPWSLGMVQGDWDSLQAQLSRAPPGPQPAASGRPPDHARGLRVSPATARGAARGAHGGA
jgi:TrmH family RNA methyltransferase